MEHHINLKAEFATLKGIRQQCGMLTMGFFYIVIRKPVLLW